MPTFEANLAAVANPDHPILIEKDTPTKALLFFPEYYLANTYRVSLLTYLIRLGNQEKEGAVIFESAIQALGTINAEVSQGLSYSGRKFAIAHGWDAREGDKYWWRYNTYTSDTPFTLQIKSYIHNCGVCAWELNNKEPIDAL